MLARPSSIRAVKAEAGTPHTRSSSVHEEYQPRGAADRTSARGLRNRIECIKNTHVLATRPMVVLFSFVGFVRLFSFFVGLVP
ncbi:hypothetical protein B0H12DRAFT_836631 [Mycena haematopus]|nr:hypothetical protein B0H12DRAFT_836631 [Mycena haematopus]